MRSARNGFPTSHFARAYWWALCSAVIGIMSFAVLLSKGWDSEWAVSAILWFTLSTIGPALICFSIQETDRLRKSLSVLCDIQHFGRPSAMGMLLSAVGFLSIALSTHLDIDVFPFEGFAKVLAMIVACAFFLSYGSLAYVYSTFVVLAVRLGRQKVNGSMFAWPRESVAAIYATYKRLLTLGAVVYLASIGIFRFTPWADSWSALNQPWVLLWVIPPGLALVAFLGVFTLALHKVLRQFRDRAEKELNSQLCHIYELWKDTRCAKAENSISELLKWRDIVRQERVWPMDLKTLVVTATTLLIPSFEAIVNVARLAGRLTS